MLRVTIGVSSNITKNLSSSEWIGINSTFSQIIRWKRKPIWLPPAKSKLFRIPERNKLSKEEDVEILRLYNNYRTYRKTIKKHLMKIVASNQVQYDEEVVVKAEEDDYNRCLEINEQWNNEVKEIRKKRLEKEKSERTRKILQKIAVQDNYNRQRLEQIKNEVERTKIEAKTFITSDNIDQAIDEALANIVNYNAAIDTEGNKYGEEYVLEKQRVQGNIQQ